MKKIAALVLTSLVVSFASASHSDNLLKKLSGHWGMTCKSSHIADGVTGVVPSWYENTKEISFLTAKTTSGSEFLNTDSSLPGVVRLLRLSLPIFYTQAGGISSHTYNSNSVSDDRIQNESHVCDIEQIVSPDFASFLSCSLEPWRNSVVRKQIVLVDENTAKIEVQTHYGDPKDDNTIVCDLYRKP